MDDILDRAGTICWAVLDRLGAFLLQALDAAGRTAVKLLAALADMVNRFAAWLAALSLWVSIPAALLLIALTVAYLFRQRLYDRVLVYHLVWLQKQGFSRHVFRICRGAQRETRQAMARPVPLPGRFGAIALYEVHPDRYARGVRSGRRDRRGSALLSARSAARAWPPWPTTSRPIIGPTSGCCGPIRNCAPCSTTSMPGTPTSRPPARPCPARSSPTRAGITLPSRRADRERLSV